MIPFVVAYTFSIDQGVATLIVGLVLILFQVWQSNKIHQIHVLTNSNFSEVKAARLAAEEALKIAQQRNIVLEKELDLSHDKEN